MDEYSFISENGNVRQIRDLIAKEKDEQQDAQIADLYTKVGQPNIFYRSHNFQSQTILPGGLAETSATFSESDGIPVIMGLLAGTWQNVIVQLRSVSSQKGQITITIDLYNNTSSSVTVQASAFIQWTKYPS